MQRDYVALLADSLSRLDEAVLQELRDLFQPVKEFTPVVLATVEKTRSYGEKLSGAR